VSQVPCISLPCVPGALSGNVAEISSILAYQKESETSEVSLTGIGAGDRDMAEHGFDKELLYYCEEKLAPRLSFPGWYGQDVYVTRLGEFRIQCYGPSSGMPFSSWSTEANPTPSKYKALFMPSVHRNDHAKIACYGFAKFPEDWKPSRYEAVIELNGPRWVSKSEMNTKRMPPGGYNPGGKRKADENEPQHVIYGEEFRPVSNLSKFSDTFFVSNFGRSKIDCVFSRGRIGAGNYLQFHKNGTIQAHVAICATFHGPPQSSEHTVDHINRNRTDNRASNLRWANKSEQAINRCVALVHTPEQEVAHKESYARMQAYEKKALADLGSSFSKKIFERLQLAPGKRCQIALFANDTFETVCKVYGKHYDMIYYAHLGLTCLEFNDVDVKIWDRFGVNHALRCALVRVANECGDEIDDMFRKKFYQDKFVLLLGATGGDCDKKLTATATNTIDTWFDTEILCSDKHVYLAFDYVCMLLHRRR